MGFFRTKDPKTGEPRLGAGVYLIICGLLIGGTILWNVRQNANVGSLDQGTPVTTVHNPSEVAPIADAASSHSETVAVESKETSTAQSVRGVEAASATANEQAAVTEDDSEDLSTIQDTMDLLRSNKEQADKEKTEAVAKARAEAEKEITELKKKSSFSTSGPMSPENSPRQPGAAAPTNASGFGVANVGPNSGGNANIAGSLVVYDVNAPLSEAQAKAQKKAAAQIATTVSGFTNGHFLPRGFSFPVYILSTVQSTGQEDIVEMGVAENVVFQHKVLLPFGTHLLGSAAASSTEDRLMINVDTILYPDGRELPISGFLKDAFDLSSGVRGYYIPQPMRVQIAPYINEFLATWTQAAADRFSGDDGDDDDSTSSAVDSSASLIRTQATKIQERLDKRYPEKVIIPIGTKAYVKLRSPLDLEQAAIAGSLQNNQAILPGFENNPVRANGTVEKTANYGVNKNAALTSATTATPATTATVSAEDAAAAKEAANRAAAQSVADSQMKSYLSGIQQLEKLTNTLSTSSSKSAAASSSVSWPSGDIE